MRFSVPEKHCEAAFRLVTAWLPDQLVPDETLQPWIQSFRQGEPDQLQARALLPAADHWPVLEPLCSAVFPDPRDAFLHTIRSKAALLFRAQRSAQAGALPFLIIRPVQDDHTLPLHQSRRAGVWPNSAETWNTLIQERVWGCRCSHQVMNGQMLKQRGITAPLAGPYS